VPNKTIYVSDDDAPLFERAQELSGGNLSSAVVRALRRFIEIEEAKQQGFNEITVTVNGDGAHRRKRFFGQRLVRWLQATADGKGTEILSVYRTAGNRYALHKRAMLDWKLSWGDPEYLGNLAGGGKGILQKFMAWGFDWDRYITEAGNFSLRVFDTLEEMKPHVSDEFYQAVSQAREGPEIEDLDI